MTKTDRLNGGAVPRYLAILVAAVLGLSLLPATAFAAHNENNTDPCDGAPVANEYVDRSQARDVHERNIDCVIFRNIAIGSTNSQGQQVYNPLREVTRGQMASFVAQTLDAAGYQDRLSDGATNRFSDIDNNVHKRNINRLADADIVEGTGGGRYSPNASITRQQMATFIVEAARFAVGEDHPITRDGADRFIDVSNNNVHKNNIEAGADADPVLFRGVSATQFDPGETVLRDQMATFLVNLLRYIFSPGRVVDVTVADSSVAAGQPVTGTISNATGATVTGCGIQQAQTLQDTDANASGFQFSVTIPSNQQPGQCTLTFNITRQDGETVSRTVNVTVEGEPTPTGQTARPELVTATIVNTVTPNQATAANPAGTRVRYCFDEAIETTGPTQPGPGGGTTAGQFVVYTFDNTRIVGPGTATSYTFEGDRCVVVNFPAQNNPDANDNTNPNRLSLATVEFDTVRDRDQNLPNPVGDRAIGGGQTAPTLQPGITTAPDLQSVGSFRTGAQANTTAVTFTFDQNAFVQDTNGFFLVLTRLNPAGPNNVPEQVQCLASQAQDQTDNPTTRTTPGGSGTTQVTVICQNPVDPNNNANRIALTAENVARGYVQNGTVSRNAAGADTNPLQAADVQGTSPGPDITAAEIRPGNPDSATASERPDRVLVTFDQQVDSAGVTATGFRLYYRDQSGPGTQAIQSTGAAVNPENRNQVLVTFDTGNAQQRASQGATGINVVDQAVRGQNQVNNRPDEQGLTNTQSTGQTAGQTTGPQLTAVALDRGTDQFGNPGNWRATYTFDEALTAAGTAQNDTVVAGQAGRFYLYTAEGVRLEGSNCTYQGATATTGATQVRCTTYTQRTGQDAGTGATQAQIRTAVLGTVLQGVVTDQQGQTNPEGAEATTGRQTS